MGFYYGPSTPPSRWTVWKRRIGKYIPQFLKNWWDDVAEIIAVTRVVLSIILPVVGMMLAFSALCIGMMVLYSMLGSR